MNVGPIIQSEVSKKGKNKGGLLMHIYGIYKYGTDEPFAKQQRRHRYRGQTCGSSRGRRGWDKLTE